MAKALSLTYLKRLIIITIFIIIFITKSRPHRAAIFKHYYANISLQKGYIIMRAALYARYSSDNQRYESITAQLRCSKEYCAQKHYDVVKIYTDATVIIGLKQNPTHGRRFSPIFFA